MGSACCVAARDRTITNGPSNDVIPRNIRYSPSWSVRWDNRRRVAGEDSSTTWYSDSAATNDRLDNKSQTTAYASEDGSPLESFRNLTWQKSSPSQQSGILSDTSLSKNPTKVLSSPSPSTHSVSSSQPRCPTRSPPRGLLRQVSDTRTKSPSFSISEDGSPFMVPGFGSTRGSYGGSSDFNTTNNNNNSFDSESFNFKATRASSSPSIDMRTCGVCAKLLTEKSSWGPQKIIAGNELAVVAILICGHVYHAECLESMTEEINKYDPACPVCTFGEKQTFKMSEKALKAEMESKARINKRSRSRVVDGDGDDVVMFDHRKSRSHKMSSSSSMKESGKPPFLKRHFSFGSKGSRSMSSDRRKGFFWAKSNKE